MARKPAQGRLRHASDVESQFERTIISSVAGKRRRHATPRAGMPPVFADVLLVMLIVLLATGISNLGTHVIEMFWIGPLALAGPICMGYVLFPSKFSGQRKYPIAIAVAGMSYVGMCILDVMFIHTSFLPILIRRSEFMLVLILILVLLRNANPKTAMITLRWSMPVATAFVLADYFLQPVSAFLDKMMHAERLEYATAHRAFGLFVNPNYAGSILALFAVLCAYGLSMPKRLFFYAVALVGVLASGSRGSMLLWVAGVMLSETVVINQAGRATVRWWRVGAAVAAMVVASILLLAAGYGPSPSETGNLGIGPPSVSRLSSTADSSIRDRAALMEHAWKVFHSKPVFGWGVGYDYNWDLALPVHNIYLGMLVEHGGIGLLWLIFFLFALSRSPVPFNIIAPTLIVIKGVSNHSIFNEIDDSFVFAMFATGCGWIGVAKSQTATGKPFAPGPTTGRWRRAASSAATDQRSSTATALS